MPWVSLALRQANRREFRVVVELQRTVAAAGDASAKSAPPPATAKGEYGLGSSLTRGNSGNDPEESALCTLSLSVVFLACVCEDQSLTVMDVLLRSFFVINLSMFILF